MRNILLCSFIFFASTLASQAQYGKMPDKDYGGGFYYGGDFGFNYGGNGNIQQLFIEFSPVVGYKFTDQLSAGPGLIFQYNSITSGTQKATLYTYGFRAFARYLVLPNLYLHAEPQILSVDKGYASYTELNKRTIVPTFLVGGGYRQSIASGNSSVSFMVLYDVIQNRYSPYSGTNFLIFRVGGSIGF